jgi:hypothetical protein
MPSRAVIHGGVADDLHDRSCASVNRAIGLAIGLATYQLFEAVTHLAAGSVASRQPTVA